VGEWGRTANVGHQGMQLFGGKSFLSVYRLSLTGGRKMIIPSDQAKRMTRWGDSAPCRVIVALVAETIANWNGLNSGPVTMTEINHLLGRGNRRQLFTDNLLKMQRGIGSCLKPTWEG